MSEDQRIVIIPISVSQNSTFHLDAVMGIAPSKEVREVLESSWAQQEGWSISAGSYSRRLGGGAGQVTIAISAEDKVSVTLRADVQSVRSPERARVEAEQSARLREREQEAKESVGNVVLRAVQLRLQRVLDGIGGRVTDSEHHIQQGLLQRELTLHVTVQGQLAAELRSNLP